MLTSNNGMKLVSVHVIGIHDLFMSYFDSSTTGVVEKTEVIYGLKT